MKRVLKAGIHSLTLEQVEELFCSNGHRKKLFNRAVRGIKNLISAGVEEIYIDGSFVSDKEFPEDIDGCWMPNSAVDSKKIDPVLLDFSNSREKMKTKYGVDFFSANIIESGSGKPFLEFFQTDRDGKRKGIIKIKLE